MPKIPYEANDYKKEYKILDGTHIIDFPGWFDSKGVEFEISFDLSFQKILLNSNSCRILVLVPATSLLSNENYIIDLIKNKL